MGQFRREVWLEEMINDGIGIEVKGKLLGAVVENLESG